MPNTDSSSVPIPDLYYGLLTNPPGTYARVKWGSSTAVVLNGSVPFRTKATNLFASFGGRSAGCSFVTYLGTRPDAIYFGMSEDRIRQALRLYLYGQIYAHKAKVEIILDSDGDFVDSLLTNESVMLKEASKLADRFYETEMTSDYAAIPDNERVGRVNAAYGEYDVDKAMGDRALGSME